MITDEKDRGTVAHVIKTSVTRPKRFRCHAKGSRAGSWVKSGRPISGELPYDGVCSGSITFFLCRSPGIFIREINMNPNSVFLYDVVAISSCKVLNKFLQILIP